MYASVPRSDRSYSQPNDGDGRSIVRIRNIRESTVYHLTFDGDIGRLTGAVLKGHIKGMSGIPSEQQILTYNGQPIYNESTGYDVGLRPGSMIILDLINRPSMSAPRAVSTSSAAEHQTPVPPASRQPVGTNATPAQQGGETHFQRELKEMREMEDEVQRAQDKLSRYHQERAIAAPQYAASGPNDDIEVEVEIEDQEGEYMPYTSADVEESRLLQQDFVWRMEQVRFETERMHREREMRRQQQELEYQAEVLERERIVLERKTMAEKMKLSMMQNAMQDEMSIHARITNYGNSHSSVDRSYARSGHNSPVF